jgi:formate dehydrogenase iron-sulfur subunit
MGVRYAFAVDLDRCIGCRACAVACGAGNEVAPGDAFIAIADVVRRRQGGLWGSFAHRRCFHCEPAACVEVCPTGTLSKWNGLTAVALERCSGCGYCADACPFQVPRIRDDQVAKCLGCAERIQDGEAPFCQQTCPTEAIRFGERDAVLAEARARALALRERHPGAQVYEERELGGLGLLLVLTDRPEAYGLPEAPRASAALGAWQAVRGAATGLSATAAVATGVMFVVARRRHLREQAEAGRDHPDPPAAGRGEEDHG